ncbi:cation:proton antiporter [Bradyrhizobium sp. 180]|uniref:cation:proton antiporter domain-containing protein n=1 Tax=Bradyrhizobium sp. 180 TaxID=2782650 RepID=UPI001FFAE4A1|nr:cation:proton antiporter [Bradyrhizobium sp. 180]
MPHIDSKVVLLLQVVVVVGLPLLIWGPLRLGKFFPLPIIQIFAGIVLGPSVFKVLAPGAFEFLFRKEVLAGIDTLSSVALVLFVFLAGCEVDRQILKSAAGKVLKIGMTGVMVPWIAGTVTAWMMLESMHGPGILGANVSPWLYSIAFGLCMAVTALPVLVIVLRELGFNERPIGTIALAVGGVDDALLWSSLTVLLPFAAGGSNNPLQAFVVAVVGAAITIVLLVFVITPLMNWLIRNEAPERMLISLTIIALFALAALNEATRLHAAIGAFLTGLLLPDKVRHLSQDRFDAPVTLLLLPFLFLSTGLKTEFSFTNGVVWWVALLAMIGGVGGKLVGVTLPARLSGDSLAFSTTLGVLMQCKGLMEIVVVTILYDQKVFGKDTFSALVLVALISTAMTVPLARLCERRWGKTATEAAPAAPPIAVEVVPALVPQFAGPRLQLVDEEGSIPIMKADAVIGRHSDDDVRIPDVRVSRHHARLISADGNYEIHNLTALRSEPNPLLVNGQEREHSQLHDGDEISLGGVKFIFKSAA